MALYSQVSVYTRAVFVVHASLWKVKPSQCDDKFAGPHFACMLAGMSLQEVGLCVNYVSTVLVLRQVAAIATGSVVLQAHQA